LDREKKTMMARACEKTLRIPSQSFCSSDKHTVATLQLPALSIPYKALSIAPTLNIAVTTLSVRETLSPAF
jgi:hypothetical protein